jgi:hypothetical protein
MEIRRRPRIALGLGTSPPIRETTAFQRNGVLTTAYVRRGKRSSATFAPHAADSCEERLRRSSRSYASRSPARTAFVASFAERNAS